MRIQRFCGDSPRQVMRGVREAMGPNAVILSHRATDGKVEIVAAVDYDEDLYRQLQPEGNGLPSAERDGRGMRALQGDAVNRAAVSEAEEGKGGAPTESRHSSRLFWTDEQQLTNVQQQIQSLHVLVEQHLSGLAWGDFARRRPHRAQLLSRLTDFGMGNRLAMGVLESTPEQESLEVAWQSCLAAIGDRLCIGGDEILREGGVVALLGPTGVGKTTTVAKLAARYTMRNGPGKVALVTTDGFRVGAFDQLKRYAYILNCPVRLAHDRDELEATLAELCDLELVLIDTAGMSQRDIRLSQQFALVQSAPGIRSYLVIAANAQHSSLREAVSAFSRIDLAGCVLTKLDETVRLGAALTAVIENSLTLAYTCSGQRVPEDLHIACARDIIGYGRDLMSSYTEGCEQEALALAFGKRLANACA